MLNHHTATQLAELGLSGMLDALNEQQESIQYLDLSFEERLGLLVDREVSERAARKLATRLRGAKLRHDACIEDIDFHAHRGLQRAVVMGLASSQWVASHQNIMLTGPTGVGKSYLACALANAAIRAGYTALYKRAPRLFQDLSIARGDGRYPKVLQQFARVDILVLDDFCLTPLVGNESLDLMEVLEDRSERRSTIVTAQLPVDAWHHAMGDPTLADAILDRLVNNAHIIPLAGDSLRKTRKP